MGEIERGESRAREKEGVIELCERKRGESGSREGGGVNVGRDKEGVKVGRESEARDKMESWVREKRLMKVGRGESWEGERGLERGSESVARGER